MAPTHFRLCLGYAGMLPALEAAVHISIMTVKHSYFGDYGLPQPQFVRCKIAGFYISELPKRRVCNARVAENYPL